MQARIEFIHCPSCGRKLECATIRIERCEIVMKVNVVPESVMCLTCAAIVGADLESKNFIFESLKEIAKQPIEMLPVYDTVNI